jgi:hypothetical protein
MALTTERPFDALRAPLRADPVARNAPDLLRVRLEERQVQLAAEPVDQKLFERRSGLIWRMALRA